MIFPFFTPSSGIRFELVSEPGLGGFASAGEPFVPLSEGGLTGRVLLAQLGTGTDQSLERIAVKLRRNQYRIPLAAGQRSQVTNKTIDELWDSERKALLEASQELGGLHPAFRPWAEYGTFPPVLFCNASRQYFHPPSPYSGRPLTVCKDNALLQSVGLRPYSESTARYLYCPVQAESVNDPTQVVFWSISRTPEEPASSRLKIRRGDDLYSDIWPVIDAVVTGKRNELTAAALETCFPSDIDVAALKRDKLAAVSFYDSEILPLQLHELNYDELSALLGGADWDSVWKGGIAGMLPGRNGILETIRPRLSAGRQFFYSDDDSGLFPLECLLLKLSMYRDLCHGVQKLHAEYNRPHLDLKPGHVMGITGSGSPTLPARWNFRISVLDLGAIAPLSVGGDAKSSTIFRPPAEPDPIYSAPYLRDEVFGKSELSHLIIRSVEAVPDGDKVRARLEIDLMNQSLRARKMSERDLLVISVPSPGGEQATTLWPAHPREPIDGGVRCFVVTAPYDKALIAGIQAMTNRVIYDREVTYYRAFSVPADIYSLGMLLVRTLLVHDGQDILTVAETLKYMRGKIELSLPRGETASAKQVEMLVREHLHGDSRTFNPYSVMHRRDHRAATRNAIPDDVWENLLVLSFRMTTQIPGFSVCTDSGDFDPDELGSRVERVVMEISAAIDRLWAELFGSQAMNRDVLSAIDLLTGEFAGEKSPVN